MKKWALGGVYVAFPNEGSDWFGTNFLSNQNYDKPKLRPAKIKVTKVRTKNIDVYLVDCQNQDLSIFSFIQFIRTF
jgi:hypothetical protein